MDESTFVPPNSPDRFGQYMYFYSDIAYILTLCPHVIDRKREDLNSIHIIGYPDYKNIRYTLEAYVGSSDIQVEITGYDDMYDVSN